jgi:hypothetical protein
MKRFDLLLILAFALLLGGIGVNKYISNREEKQPEPKFDLLTVQVEKGWAYEIWINGKRYIFQDQIPAISETIPFATKMQAQMVGCKVLEKMRNHQNPSVKKEELIQWGILNSDGIPKSP